MPASSVDTFFACSLMVILIVSAMVSTAKVVQPYLNDLSNMNGVERYRGLAEYVLLSTGEPSNWGKLKVGAPTDFGLASETQRPYELGLDKVSRLNSDNVYSVTYEEIIAALGIKDISLNIKISPLLEVSIDLASRSIHENETIYTFQIVTGKSGLPIPTWLQCYAVVGSYIDNVSSSTSSSGIGFVNASLPSSVNGTALFLVFAEAKAYPQVVSSNVYSFGHNSEIPEPGNTFLQLSPLDHVLNATLLYPNVSISNAYVFTYDYSFNLSQTASETQTVEYSIPHLLGGSPMMLVFNGNNASTSFAEWTGYPQLPLEIGADLTDLTARSKAIALTYIVNINSVFHEFVITSRIVKDYHA